MIKEPTEEFAIKKRIRLGFLFLRRNMYKR